MHVPGLMQEKKRKKADGLECCSTTSQLGTGATDRSEELGRLTDPPLTKKYVRFCHLAAAVGAGLGVLILRTNKERGGCVGYDDRDNGSYTGTGGMDPRAGVRSNNVNGRNGCNDARQDSKGGQSCLNTQLRSLLRAA
ncbi:hypothetical protein VTK73DRAFT_3123 [Phialemonium thermophilum]|uniref:Uncharacterized protein n=1 Tax=Phialemonium thermophilum TaxID=223376 RepID=A0ABR3VL65_9PEZI